MASGMSAAQARAVISRGRRACRDSADGRRRVRGGRGQRRRKARQRGRAGVAQWDLYAEASGHRTRRVLARYASANMSTSAGLQPRLTLDQIS